MSSEIAVRSEEVEPSYQGGSAALVDIRSAAMSVNSDQMRVGLAEYKDRRDTFRRWLLSQLVAGVHYGVPPGCEPKFDAQGNLQVWMKGGMKSISPEQWQHKPSLYQAGADFIIDLMNLRAEFAADLGAWEMLGKVDGKIVYKCQLFSRATGELVGEGIGARTIGDKGGDLNNGVKMACKCAKVAAVINSYGLSDLFTQDLEDRPGPEKHANPEQVPNAPKATPRAERGKVTKQAIEGLRDGYKNLFPKGDPEGFRQFCFSATAHSFMRYDADEQPVNAVMKLEEWTAERINKVWEKIEEESAQ